MILIICQRNSIRWSKDALSVYVDYWCDVTRNSELNKCSAVRKTYLKASTTLYNKFMHSARLGISFCVNTCVRQCSWRYQASLWNHQCKQDIPYTSISIRSKKAWVLCILVFISCYLFAFIWSLKYEFVVGSLHWPISWCENLEKVKMWVGRSRWFIYITAFLPFLFKKYIIIMLKVTTYVCSLKSKRDQSGLFWSFHNEITGKNLWILFWCLFVYTTIW